jgi:hypothetical protein
MGRDDLVPLLEPNHHHHDAGAAARDEETLRAIEAHLHLREDLVCYGCDYEFRMPQLSVMLEVPGCSGMHVEIPGMCGGWRVRLVA